MSRVVADELFNDEFSDDTVGLIAVLNTRRGELSDMTPVAKVTGREVPATGKATDRAFAYIQGLKEKVNRKGFGEVLFSKTKLKNSYLGHGFGEAKIQLMAAVPGVIESGKQVAFAKNWKNRGYDSYVFAGPADYAGRKVYVAAIVIRDDANRYYLHEAVDENGNVIYTEKESPELASDRSPDKPKSTVANPEPSMDSIPSSAAKSNTENAEGKTSQASDSLEELRQENEELQGKVKEFEKALRQREKQLQAARESRDNWRPGGTAYPSRRARRREEAVSTGEIPSYNGTAADAAMNPKEERNLYAENTRTMRNGLMAAAEEEGSTGQEQACCGGNDRAPACGNGQGCLPGRCAAMVFPYVPMQPVNARRYGQKEALREGTLFPGLNLPFHRELESRFPAVNTPLSELMALDFAIQELGLYLNTHRDDEDALALFRSYVKLSREGREKYTATYGPLMQTEDVNGAYTWLDDPWPWEKGGND